jgi:type VI secretion system protein ImpK
MTAAPSPRSPVTRDADDLLARTYWAAADVLALAIQLSQPKQLLPVDELQRRISALFEQMGRRFRDLGIPEEDATEVKYAICAFIDEQLFKLQWPGRQAWLTRPLQLVYFNENTAGEGFYARLDGLRRQPHRANVLQIYYLCLELGFLGQHAVRPEGQRAVADVARGEVLRQLGNFETISPHGEPRDPPMRNLAMQERPILAVGAGLFGLALLIVIILKLVLVVGTSQTTSELAKGTSAAAGARP